MYLIDTNVVKNGTGAKKNSSRPIFYGTGAIFNGSGAK
jgi:hypothetical protein